MADTIGNSLTTLWRRAFYAPALREICAHKSIRTYLLRTTHRAPPRAVRPRGILAKSSRPQRSPYYTRRYRKLATLNDAITGSVRSLEDPWPLCKSTILTGDCR